NPDHHVLQAKLLRAMVEAGRRPAVGFEMLATDDAPAIVRYLARSPKDAAGLGDAVNWSRSGWPEWRFYQPIAQVALDASVPIVATNLSRAATDAVRRNGLPGLGPPLMSQLRLAEPTPRRRSPAITPSDSEATRSPSTTSGSRRRSTKPIRAKSSRHRRRRSESDRGPAHLRPAQRLGRHAGPDHAPVAARHQKEPRR